MSDGAGADDSVTWARWYAAQSFVPVPLHGKDPSFVGGAWQRQAEAAAKAGDVSRFAGRNVGLLLGSSGLADVDCDCPEAALFASHYLPKTACFGRRSHPKSHYLYRCTGAKALKLSIPGQTLVELRAGDCQSVVPPSLRHHDPKKAGSPTEPPFGTSEPIEWCEPLTFAEIEAPELARLVRLIAAGAALRRVWPAPGQGGHTCDLALAGALLSAGWSVEDTFVFCELVGCTGNQVDTTRARVDAGEPVTSWGKLNELLGRKLVDSVRKWLAIAPTSHACSDDGNALRLVDRHGDDLRFGPGVGWLAYNGKQWQRDDANRRVELARDTARAIWAEIPRASEKASLVSATKADEDRLKRLAAHAQASQARSRIEAMLALAQSDPAIIARVEDLDRDPYALGCTNGVVDLKSSALRSHERSDLITKLAGCAYDPTAQAPTWESFLERVVPDATVREFLRRAVGYSLTGSAAEHVVFFLFGTGANGKSVFLRIVCALLGEHACKTPRGLLSSTRNEKHPTEFMNLRGSRMAWCSEVDESAVWDEAKIKDLASEDPITAHYMRCDDVTWTPTHKLWIAGNHKPRVMGTDEGLWRRLRLVPFGVVIPKNERDPKLTDRLMAELPGILRWAVEGCLAWQRDGLGEPTAVVEATDAYREEQDLLGRFLAEHCEVGPGGGARGGELYQAYAAWAVSEGLRAVSNVRFARSLQDRGLRSKKINGCVVWEGVRVARVGLQ